MKPRIVSRLAIPLFGVGMIFLLGAGISGCGRSSDSASKGTDAAGQAASPQAGGGPGGEAPAPVNVPPATAEEVLGKLVETYRSARSYRDSAFLQLTGVHDGQPWQTAFPCELALERPNKIRMLVDNGNLLCDGAEAFGFVRDLPGQVVRLPAPQQLSVAEAYPDFLLATAMMQSPAQFFSWVPIQAVLLLANDPLKTILSGAQRVELLEPAMLDERACYRVGFLAPEGPAVLWIDAADSVLRRFEFPTRALRQEAAAEGIEDVAMVLELRDAQIDPQISPQAFLFQVPEGVAPTDALALPILRILGQPSPDFQFTDLQGSETSLASLKDKVVVIQLWTSTSVPCRPVLQAISRAHETLRGFDDVVVMAVSLDGANVQGPTLQAVLKDWQVDLPVYRDLARSVATYYGDPGVPLTMVVGKGGIVQTFQPGALPQMDQLLLRVVERLRQGEDVFPFAFEQFEAGREQFELMRQQSVSDDLYRLPAMGPQNIPRAEIAQRAEPENVKMTRLWSSDRLEQPGNIAVVPGRDGAPRILVMEKSTSVVELDRNGEVAADYPLDLEGSELVTVLDTAVGRDGRRYYLGSARGVQRVHLFDENLKTLLAYPDASHTGIGAAQLVDLDGNGRLEMLIGYFDVAGVQVVDLEGERLWADRSLHNAFRVAPLAPEPGGQRHVLALNSGPDMGTIVEFDAQGKRLREIALTGRSIGWFAAADLDGNGVSEICVLAQVAPGEVVVMGINLAGQELWRHALPTGVHHQQIEPVLAGNIFPGGPGQWLVASADGAIHIIGIDGRMIESFAYGAELAGMATAELDGKGVLLVSTTSGVEAWQVEQAAASPTVGLLKPLLD